MAANDDETNEHSRKDSTSYSMFSDDQILVDALISQALEDKIDDSPNRGVDRLEQINIAIAACKEKLREFSLQATPVGTPTDDSGHSIKKLLVDKIVDLGLEKQNLQDAQEDCVEMKKCNGHTFVLQSARGRNPCCEVCMGTIWRLVQYWRRCRACGMRVHEKCAEDVRRVCAAVIGLQSDFHFSNKICAEVGLLHQNYKCAECEHPLSYDSGPSDEPRLCELTGLYYCPSCHWNDEWPIPARLIHNMDPTPYPVCRASKQLLSVTQHKPLIAMLDTNPRMFALHSGLKKVQRFRKDFLIMKCYFISCKNARSLRILQYLRQHQHFVEDAKLYTLDELKEIALGGLCRELEDIHTVFRRHIEDECETCRGNGFYCELCATDAGRNQILFPFTDGISMCKKCYFVFHKACYEKAQSCPRCERREKRERHRSKD
ncbi:unnamed protein product, partial [Mesorhabditis belari]|uniref:Phorbol-ester/DAG-type domain-containing protein n=1 Tax=Mesorhabditis belari TaxID=2138241 RepID=A0AAF3J1W5_9BILA